MGFSYFAPVQATFLSGRYIDGLEPWMGWFIIDIVVTICFLGDMFIQFRTSWYKNGIETYSDTEAVLRYMGLLKTGTIGWFWVDVLSLIPFQNFVPHRGESVRLFKLMKLTKILRVVRAASLYQRAREALSRRIGYNNLRLITCIILIVYCSHILSCLLLK